MPGVNVKIDSKLGRIPTRLKAEVNRGVREQVLATEGDVAINIVKFGAVDTGTMLGSVAGTMTGDVSGQVSVSAESAEGYPYPQIVNFGGRFVPARPFFSDAVEQARVDFPRRFDGIGVSLVR